VTRRSVVVAVLTVVCIASVAANVLLSGALYRAFAEIQEGRLFPLGRDARRESERGLADGPEGTVDFAVFGDSRALAWAASLRGTRGVDVVSFARGGETSAQLRLRLATEPRPRAHRALLQIGINDLHPLGALPSLRGEVRRRLFENVDAVVDRLRESSDCLIVTTVPPPGPVPLERRPVWDESTVQVLRELNERLRAKAALPGVTVVDAARLLAGDSDRLPVEYVDPDFFLHFNAAAYARLDDALLETTRRSGHAAQSDDGARRSAADGTTGGAACGTPLERR
jgi:lysophospholipase L1-like esterase